MENAVKEIMDILNHLLNFFKKKAKDFNLYNPKSATNNANQKSSSNNNGKNKQFTNESKPSSSKVSTKTSVKIQSHRNTGATINQSQVLNGHPRLKEYVKPNISEKRQELEKNKSKKDPKLDAFKKDQLKKQVIIQIEKNIDYLGELSIALSNEGYYDYDVKVIELIQQSRGCLNIIRRLGIDKIYFDKTYQAIKEHTDNIATLLET